jgi:hypothetical protein
MTRMDEIKKLQFENYEQLKNRYPQYLPTEVFPKVLPWGWETLPFLTDSCAWRHTEGLVVIGSVSIELDKNVWAHLSASRQRCLPSWEDMVEIKNIFLGPERKAINVIPPRKEHVNINPNVHHLFACLTSDPLPDFTHGTGSL